MPIVQISGTHVKGVAISDNEPETQEFIKQLRDNGATVRLKRRYETFIGERLEVNPPIHRISWEYG